MTVEEALAASEAEPVNDIFLINPETRTITVPETEKSLVYYMTETLKENISAVRKS